MFGIHPSPNRAFKSRIVIAVNYTCDANIHDRLFLKKRGDANEIVVFIHLKPQLRTFAAGPTKIPAFGTIEGSRKVNDLQR